jgi:WD40 repeat protein
MVDLETRKLDVTKSREIKQLEHAAQLTTCRFSPCGKFIIAGSLDGSVQRWNLEDESQQTLSAHHGWVTDLAFSPKGTWLYTVDSWGKICSWNYAEAEPQPAWVAEDAHPKQIRDVEVSCDGELLATVGDDFVVRIWTAADGKPAGELLGHLKNIHSVAFHPDGKHVVSGDLVGRVIIWDLQEKKMLREFDASVLHKVVGDGTFVGGGVRGLAFSHDGAKLICSGITDLGTSVVPGFPAVMQFDWTTGNLDIVLRPHNYEHVYGGKGIFVEDLRFHNTGFLAACGGNGERPGAIWFWKLGQVEPLHEINGDMPGSRSIDLHPDGFRMAVSQFKENGRGINGGNGKHADDGEYHDHHGLIRIYELAKE